MFHHVAYQELAFKLAVMTHTAYNVWQKLVQMQHTIFAADLPF